jgi:hypothetical protein
MLAFLKALAKFIYYGTISLALFLFSILVLIQVAALWQWFK